MVSKAVKQIIV